MSGTHKTRKKIMQNQFDIFKNRRQNLVATIKKEFPSKKGTILLFASFESERYKFKQESSFYYLTGLTDPAAVIAIDLDGKTTMYMPAYNQDRDKWVGKDASKLPTQLLNMIGIDKVESLGKPCNGYQFSCLFNANEYENLIDIIKKQINQNNTIFTINSNSSYIGSYVDQKLILEKLYNFIPNLNSLVQDISPIIAKMRRTKTQYEVEEIYNAVDCTMAAHESVAAIIKPDSYEYQLQAGLEFIFTETNASPAFPSIVASGVNATILHYNENKEKLKKGDLVLIDIGAQLNYYCSDITRTYPISGSFTKRQSEVYTLVLELQEYIADLAKPGIWLSNKAEPTKSLHHLAIKFLEKTGYGQYFTHSIGHFLGLDVHDVGDYSEPLKEGDVITIEPGLYIPQEKMGIRIEDNYWIVKDGVVCLSQELPKDLDTIEAMMAQDYAGSEESEDDEDVEF